MENYDKELTRIKSVLRGTTKGLTVTEIARFIQINRNSVAKYLDILLTSGQVEMKAVGSAKIYSMTKRIPVSSILSLSSDYIFVIDYNSIITYVNDNVLNFERKNADEIIGKSVDSVSLIFFSVTKIHALIKEGIGGTEITRELEVIKANQSFYFRAKFVPSILENRKKGLLLILEDITEIKKYQNGLEKTVALQDEALTTSYEKLTSEQEISKEVKGAYVESERRYHNLIELAQEGVLTINSDGFVIFSNKKLSEILGYSAHEIKDRSIYSFTDEKNAGILKRQVVRLKLGNPQYFTITFIKKDGSIVYTRLAASSGLDENGKFSYGLFLISDISELKKADDAVRQSELHNRTLVETMPNGVITMSSDGIIQTANIHAVKMLGYTKIEEAIGKNLFDYIAPNDIEQCSSVMKRAMEKGFTKNTECTLISKDSSGLCAEINISTIRNGDSIPTTFVCILTDITERRKADYMVRKSEEKHRALVEGLSNIIFTTDTKGKLTYVSPVIQGFLGYESDELTGKHFYKLAPPDERHKIGLMLKEALSDKTGPEEYRMLDKTGNLHEVRIIAHPYWEKNKLAGINGLIEDITDLKKTENKLKKIELQYKAVVEDQMDLICRFRPDFSITFVNPAYCRYYGKPEDEILNTSILHPVSQNEQKKIREIINSLTQERPVKTFEHKSVSLKGITHSYYTTIRAIYNLKGEAIEFQLSSRDITELEQYYEKSQQLLEELQRHQIELETQNEELRRLRQQAERSERKYLDLYDYAPAGYFTLAPNGIITGVNLTGGALLGKSREQVLNTSLHDYIAPENRQTFISFCKRIFESSRKQMCEITLIRSDTNEQQVIQVDGKRIEQEQAGENQCRIVMTDITERVNAEKALRNSEDRLKKMINGSPVPIFVIDKNHQVLYWNTAMNTCTGIKAKDVIGTNRHWKGFYPQERACLADLIVDGAYDKITEMYPKLASKVRLIDGAYEAIDFFPSIGGQGKWLHFTASPVYDTQHNIIAALETIVDITDMKLAEETVKSANRKINALTSITRHDIINQLTVLLTYIGYLEESLPENPSVKKHSEKIRTAANTIQQLIIFTREYQNLGMEKAKWHNLEQVINKSMGQINTQNINLDIKTGAIEIYADPLIERVFYNLIDYSIRYGEHVKQISISFQEEAERGIIVYEDDGIGIPSAIKNKLFSPGFSKNRGFGFYLSKEILDYTGISIHESGKEPNGARFEIGVPKNLYKKSS